MIPQGIADLSERAHLHPISFSADKFRALSPLKPQATPAGHFGSELGSSILSRRNPCSAKYSEDVLLSACLALAVVLYSAWHAHAQDAKNPFPTMAPLDQYLISDRNAEIALARSAAPESISKDADVMILGRHGYETAVKGKNGFVCLVYVAMPWAGPIDDADFWNPAPRSPVCLNPAAARFNVPLTEKRTELILAGRSKTQMFCRHGTPAVIINFAEFPALQTRRNRPCYMLSKQSQFLETTPVDPGVRI